MNYVEVIFKINPFKPFDEIITARLSAVDYESFVVEPPLLKAYVQEKDFNLSLLQEALLFEDDLPDISYDYHLIREQNWNAEWERNFPPVEVGKFCRIRAPFHPSNAEFQFEIIIEPKMSFGTGHHATTYLMIESIKDLDLENKTVLDMGCGTGVLAILAEMKNAGEVTAIDIEDWAYENTKENIQKNNCNQIIVLKGGAELLEEKCFDVVFANINRNILLKDMPAYVKAMKEKATVLFSGFFESDIPMLKDRARELGLSFNFSKKKEDWCLLCFQKKD